MSPHVAAVLVWSVTASAQSPAEGPQTQDSLVRDALSRYQAGLEALKNGSGTQEPTAANGQAGRPIRDLRMSDVVALALEKNLDIAVERINPSAVDLQIAGFKNTYLPVVTSTIGQRDVYQLPRDQLQGGDRVSQATTTFNGALTQNMPWHGGTLLGHVQQQPAGLVERPRSVQPDVHERSHARLHAAAPARAGHRPDAAAAADHADQPRDL